MKGSAAALGAFVALLAPASVSARPAAACDAGSTLYTVAHPDDSILFMVPDLPTDVANGRCVRTVFVTAGDAGLAADYWQSREEGVKASYADLAHGPNTWQQSDAGIPGHPAPVFTMTARPTVSVMFLRLPDGDWRGRGFTLTGNVSLEKLWSGAVASLTAVDGTSTYSRTDLIAALAAEMKAFAPDTVKTMDFVGSFGDRDHSDHHAAAYFTKAAGALYRTPHKLTGYLAYGTSSMPMNVLGAAQRAKVQTFFVYTRYDPYACQTMSACYQNGYAAWLYRQYVAGTANQGVGPVAVPPAVKALRKQWVRSGCRSTPTTPACKRLRRALGRLAAVP